MSRYIDADFEIAHYTSMTTNPTPDVTEKDKRNSLIILDALRMAPSIDIVRCGECKWLRYCETENLDPYLDCDKPDGGGIPRNEEWFCADGERRTDE